MGLDLTWDHEAHLAHGNCSKHLQTVEQVYGGKREIPTLATVGAKSSAPNAVRDATTRYARYRPESPYLEDIEIPEGEKEYALEFASWEETLTPEQAKQHLKDLYRKHPDVLRGITDVDRYVEAEVASRLTPGTFSSMGMSFIGGLCFYKQIITKNAYQFVRWLDKDEFDEIAEEARRLAVDTDGDLVTDAWNTALSFEEQAEECRHCPLSTVLREKVNPPLELIQAELREREPSEWAEYLKGITAQLVRDEDGNLAEGAIRQLVLDTSPYLLDIASYVAGEMEKIPECEDAAMTIRSEYGAGHREGCYRGYAYSYWETFFDTIKSEGSFELLTSERLHRGGEIEVHELDRLESELLQSREILERQKIGAMAVYDLEGKLLETYPGDAGMLGGDSTYGYGVGIESDQEGITVVHKDPGVFGIPVEVRRELADTEGLDAFDVLMALGAKAHEERARFCFQEIYREGDTFFGRTIGGALIELMPEQTPHKVTTPFDGFLEIGSESIGKIAYTKISAKEGFDYIQRLLEKHLHIAKRFGIPIIGA